MDYRKIIESRYNSKDWQELLHDIFRQKIQFWKQPQQVPVDEAMAKQAFYTGKITLSDGHILAVYEVELSDNVSIKRNRAGIRNLLCSNWKGMGCVGAFMFCFRKNEAVLRFSYVSESFAFAEDGSLKKESTDTKRFTYLLGKGHRSRTAIKQFEELKKSTLDLKAITKAFSVEALSDAFFNEYKKQYEDIVEFITGKRMVKVSNKWEEEVTGKPCEEIMQEFRQFQDAEKAIRDYVKKLMGRLVFIQFLQKKGWMGCPAGDTWNGGDKEFVQNLFAKAANKDTFVDDVLEPLFNDINTKRTGDLTSSPNIGTNIKIPYLNGGLFEKDNKDNISFPLPKKFMQNLLDFFASYNFTIDENDPDDAEIGVDPEMLGRIFENMLEDNKDKGAFYTPKEIVQYMCRESLIAYLQTNVTDEATKEEIRQFVTTHDATTLTDELKTTIDQKLRDVKICDPAIGSGAFPMGLLHELYACRKPLEDFDEDTAVSIKTHIIQNNIYGVDIENGAVEIARLRFWLALVVDEKTPHALPNLDFKIMQGNSLLEQYEEVDLSGLSINEQEKKKSKAKKQDAWQPTFAFDEQDSLNNIQHAMGEYYRTDSYARKIELREIIDKNVKSYIVNLKGCTPEIKEKIKNLQIPNNQFFLWHIYFKEVFDTGGFDIVIGNPPYISTATQVSKPVLAIQRDRIIASKKFSTLHSKWDLYIPFIEQSLHLLANKGISSMIVPYPLTNQIYAKKIRNLILQEFDLFEFVDLNGTKIFANATVSSCIPFVRKKKSCKHITTISHIYDNKTIQKDFSKKDEDLMPDKKTCIWYVDEECREINKYAHLHVLGDFCYVSKGMVLYSEDGDFTNKDLISECQDSIHCRKYIEAKDIERYEIQRTRYIEYNTHRVPDKVSRPTFRELYNVPKLITNCLGELKVTVDLDEQYICQQGLRLAVLWKDIANVENKSITSSIKKYSTLTRKEMERLSSKIDLKYILGIMASKYGRELLTIQRAGDYHIVPEHIRNIPIVQPTNEEQKRIINLVDRILLAKKRRQDTLALEHEIDLLVYGLYGLTPEEIAIVEGTNNK